MREIHPEPIRKSRTALLIHTFYKTFYKRLRKAELKFITQLRVRVLIENLPSKIICGKNMKATFCSTKLDQ